MKEKNENDIGFAEQEFYAWCGANDIDCDTAGMNEDELRSFERVKKAFAKAVQEKRLVVDGGSFTYTISDKSPGAGEKLTVSPPNGRAWSAMGEAKNGNGIQMLQFFMASMCGIARKDIEGITRLAGKDYKLLQGVAALFLTE